MTELTATHKLLAGLLILTAAAGLVWDGKVTADAWANVTVWTFALLVIERPITAAFGAITVSAKAKMAQEGRSTP